MSIQFVSSAWPYLYEVVSLVQILGEDSGGEAIVGVIGTFEQVVEPLEAQDLLNRPEDLTPGDLHVVANVAEHRRLDEVALRACG